MGRGALFSKRRLFGGLLFFVLLLGVLLRWLSAFKLSAGMGLVSDAGHFAEEAKDWLSCGHPEAFYLPPGNTALLLAGYWLFGPSTFGSRALMVAVSSLTALFAARLGGRLGGRRAMLWTGVVGALYTPAILLSGQSYSQHLAGLCLVVLADFGSLAVTRGRFGAAVIAGVALGAGVLARPSMASVVPVIAYLAIHGARRAPNAAPLSTPRGSSTEAKQASSTPAKQASSTPAKQASSAPAKQLLVIGAVALGCVAPALIHNHAAGEGWTVSTNNERNLFLGNNKYTPDYKTSHLAQRLPEELPDDVRDYLHRFEGTPDRRRRMQAEALAYMTTNPGRTLYRTFNRARAFWGFDYLATRVLQQYGSDAQRRAGPFLLALEAGGFLLAAALAVCALGAASRRARRPVARWLVALVVAYQVPYLIAFSSGTYHFPVMGLVWPFAGVAIAHLTKVGARQFLQGLGPPAIAGLVALLVIQGEYAYETLRMASP